MEIMSGFRRVGLSLAVVALAMGCGEDWTHLDVTPAGEAPAPVETVAAAEPAAVEAAADAAPATSAAKPSGALGTTGGSGFLWKPVAESDGRLVVLIPPQYTGQIESVFIARRTGTVVEQGAYGGVHNGGREHFRFSKAGGAYGTAIFVVADLSGGASVNWYVPNGSSRTEY